MSRAERVAEAQRLKGEGLKQTEIAQRMGVSDMAVSLWLNYPEGMGREQRLVRAARVAERVAGGLRVLDWTNAKRADGPAFVVWLEGEGLLYQEDDSPDFMAREDRNPTPIHKPRLIRTRQLGDNVWRRISDWRRGEGVLLQTVDDVLVKLGRHLSELPDEVWVS